MSTNDIWTESNKMYFFIAITAHYIIKDKNGAYQLHHSLIGFKYLPGSHSGDHIAHTLFDIYSCLGITHQVSTKSPIICYLTPLTAWCNHYGQCFIKWHCNECATAAIGRQRHCHNLYGFLNQTFVLLLFQFRPPLYDVICFCSDVMYFRKTPVSNSCRYLPLVSCIHWSCLSHGLSSLCPFKPLVFPLPSSPVG